MKCKSSLVMGEVLYFLCECSSTIQEGKNHETDGEKVGIVSDNPHVICANVFSHPLEVISVAR